MGFLAEFDQSLERSVRRSEWLGEGSTRKRAWKTVGYWVVFMLLLVGAFLFAFEGSLEPLAIVIIICGALVYGLMMVAFLTRSAGPMKAAIAIVLIGVVWTTAIVVSGFFDGR